MLQAFSQIGQIASGSTPGCSGERRKIVFLSFYLFPLVDMEGLISVLFLF